jgi:hypothetical protein
MKNQLFTLTLSLLLSSSSFAQTLDSSFSSSGKQLTDEQAAEAQNFVHQGRKDALMKEACAQKGMTNCDSSQVGSKGVILPAMLEDNIGKLYAVMFGGMGFLTGGGGPKVNMKSKSGTATQTPAPAAPATQAAGGTTPATPEKPAKEQKADYCIYIAMGSEVLIGAAQTAMQSNAQKASANLNDSQLAALVNLKEAHKARRKTATLQSALYGATTACYIARGTIGGAAMDAKYILKMTAAGAIAVLYKAKANKHANAEKQIQKVIDSLPKAGDCNPWTGTSCFCKEKTSSTLYPSQYQDACVLNVANATNELSALPCAITKADGSVQIDQTCSCKANNTCSIAKVTAYNPQFPLGANFMNQANNGLDLINSGIYDQAKLDAYTTGAAAINNKKLLAKVNTKAVPSATLTTEQKKVAEDLGGILPENIASQVASMDSGSPSSGGLMDSATSSAFDALPETVKEKVSDAEINGGYSKKGGGFDTAGTDEPGFTMPNLAPKAESENGVEVMNFAEKAISNADVSNAPETPIFDIISNRYKRSAWREFELGKKQ